MKLNETCDTLAKWMSHYLAEQMIAARSAKGQAEKQTAENRCCETILRLWTARANLPSNARPLGHLDEAINALHAMQSDQAKFPVMVQRAADQINSPWLAFATDSYAADKRIAWIAFLTGVIEAAFGQEKRWVDEHPEHLSEQERKMIELLDGWLRTDMSWITQMNQKSIAELPPEERTQIILKELKATIDNHAKAYKALEKHLQSGGKHVRKCSRKTR